VEIAAVQGKTLVFVPRVIFRESIPRNLLINPYNGSFVKLNKKSAEEYGRRSKGERE